MENNLTLMELSDAIVSVIETGYKLDPETGEIFWDSSNLNELEESLQKKAEACAVVMKGKDVLINGIDAEIKSLQDRKKAIVKQKEDFAEYLSMCVEICGGVIETPKARMSFRKSHAVEVIDDEAIPEEYLSIKKVCSVNKTAVKDAIKRGDNVPGCVLVEKKNLQVK